MQSPPETRPYAASDYQAGSDRIGPGQFEGQNELFLHRLKLVLRK